MYRAVDKAGATVDFLLTAKRDRKAALRFLRKAIEGNGMPEKITIDKGGANKAAINSHNSEHEADIEIRQVKYLNNIVEQDHRAIKRLTRPMLGFKSFRSAVVTLAGIELMHMIRKGQLRTTGGCKPKPPKIPAPQPVHHMAKEIGRAGSALSVFWVKYGKLERRDEHLCRLQALEPRPANHHKPESSCSGSVRQCRSDLTEFSAVRA